MGGPGVARASVALAGVRISGQVSGTPRESGSSLAQKKSLCRPGNGEDRPLELAVDGLGQDKGIEAFTQGGEPGDGRGIGLGARPDPLQWRETPL